MSPQLVVILVTEAYRLALEGDQKRVTPLHLTCALYSSPSETQLPETSGSKTVDVNVKNQVKRVAKIWS